MSKPKKVINNPVFVCRAVYGYRLDGNIVKGSEYTIETLNTLYSATFSDSDHRDAFVQQIKDRGFK